MPEQIPNVRTWSKTVPSYLFDVGDLDVYVLKENDEVLSAMGRTRGVRAGWHVLDLLVLAAVAAPVIAIAVLAGGRLRSGQEIDGVGGHDGAAVAAWLFALAVPGPLLVGLRWWRCQRHWSNLEAVGLGSFLGIGALVLVQMERDAGVDVLGLAPISLTVWLTVIGAAVVGTLVAVWSRGKQVDFHRHYRVSGPADQDRVRQLIGDLEPRRLEKLMQERGKAIGRLRDRGLIDDSQAVALRELPLGSSSAGLVTDGS